MAALCRLAARRLEDLKRDAVILCILEMLFDMHFLIHYLLIAYHDCARVGGQLQVRALRHLRGFDYWMS